MHKRIIAAFLSVVMLAAIPAQAAELTTPGGTTSSDVTFTVGDTAPKVFSVTVPAEIPMNMDLNGNLTVAANLSIGNASSEAVRVTAISVDGKNGWSIEDWATDLSSEPQNTAKLALEFRGDGTAAGGAISLSDGNWEIATASSLPLNAKAKMPRWTQESSKASIAQVNWTIDWADGSVTPPPDIGHTITIGTGEHGKVNDPSDLTTNAAGKITSFPSTTPDNGYIFDHWEDESGKVVDVDTVFSGDATIKPVFVVDPSYNPSNDTTITTDEATKLGFTFAPYSTGLEITKFENVQFKAEINVPEQIGDFKVLKLGAGVFKDQTNLKKVTLPDSVTELGAEVFSGCASLESIVLSNSIKDIPNKAFSGCQMLAQISLDGVESIGESGFQNCAALSAVELPQTLTDLGKYAFSGSGVGELNLPDSVARITTEDLDGMSYVSIGASTVVASSGKNRKSVGTLAFRDGYEIKQNIELLDADKVTVPDSWPTEYTEAGFRNVHFKEFEVPSNCLYGIMESGSQIQVDTVTLRGTKLEIKQGRDGLRFFSNLRYDTEVHIDSGVQEISSDYFSGLAAGLNLNPTFGKVKIVVHDSDKSIVGYPWGAVSSTGRLSIEYAQD